MPSLRASAAFLTVALSCSSILIAAVPGQSLEQEVVHAAYLTTVAQYGRGEWEAALDAAARLPPGEVVAHARLAAPGDAATLLAAAVMHAELAGRVTGELARAHRAAAYAAADRVAGSEGVTLEPKARRETVLLVAAVLQAALDVTGVELLLRRGLEAFPDDPELLTARGAWHELFAVDPPGTSPASDGSQGRRAARLATADYLRALSRDPGLVEARIRLGRVQLERGRLQAARATLERARHESTGGPLRYFACLFLGTVYEELSLYADAEGSYTTAMELYPEAQTPYIAMAHLRHRRGRLAAAAAVIGSILSRGEQSITDPWWAFHYGQFWSVPDRVQRLRRHVHP